MYIVRVKESTKLCPFTYLGLRFYSHNPIQNSVSIPASRTGCPSLTLENGGISFSNMSFMGSEATHTCDRENGYLLDVDNSSVTELTRTCAASGWSGTEITCECKLNMHSLLPYALSGG